MSFATINESTSDEALAGRIVAATVQEAWNSPTAGDTTFGRDVQTVAENARRMVWPVCTASDIEAAYASALAAGNPDPGGDEAAITDGMILSAVQARWLETDPAP